VRGVTLAGSSIRPSCSRRVLARLTTCGRSRLGMTPTSTIRTQRACSPRALWASSNRRRRDRFVDPDARDHSDRDDLST
jgi:hypothetical protein